jgi:hypothetical protein
MTLQDSPIDLLQPEFNLMSAKTDSTAIKSNINSKIIRLATPLVLDHLFNQLFPGYSKEPHAALDHIRHTYNNADGNSIFLSVYDYYTQILAASQLFMDREILPVSIYQAFIDGLDPCLMASFHTHFPDYRKSQDCAATNQCKALQEMLQAALCPETEYNNIRVIASKVNGFGGQAFPAQAHASQAEKTITRYSHSSRDDGRSNKSFGSSQGPLRCYGCWGPHPQSLLENGIHVIKCPITGISGILENTKKVIKCICSKCKKKQLDFTMCKNFATTNYRDFFDAGKERIQRQVLNSVSITSEMASVAHATPLPSPAKSDQKRIVFLCNAKAISSNIIHPILLVMIQSILPHIQLQLGTDINDSSCPSIRCVVETAAALCTGNYHFFAAITKQFPQCITKIILSEDYSPIILSGLVQDNLTAITTNLPVAF